MKKISKNNRYFYTIQEVKSFVNESLINYFGLENSTHFEKYKLPKIEVAPGEFEDEPVELDVFYRASKYRPGLDNLTYFLTLDDQGPFSFEDKKFQLFLANITHLMLRYTIKSAIPVTRISTME
jgi:hypothetical protein